MICAVICFHGCIFEYPNCPDDDWRHLRVVFDTSLCPDADPEGMSVFFFSDSDPAPWRFDFSGLRGGTVDIAEGVFSVLAYNNDTYRTQVTDADVFSLCEFTTPATDVFSGVGPLSRAAIPGGPPDGSEQVLKMPQKMWCGALTDINTASDSVLTVCLRPAVCDITVVIDSVANISDISRLAAVITGMPASYRCSSLSPTQALASIPFSVNRESPLSASLTGSLTAFIKADHSVKSYIILYVWLTDGKKFYYKFDVTDIIREQPNPLNVHIHLGPIEVPPSSGGDSGGGSGGMDVGVDSWDFVIIDMESE